MLVIPVVRAAGLPPPAVNAREATPQATGALPLAPRTSVPLSGLGVLRAAGKRAVCAAVG